MGKQYNKVLKRKRRHAYLERKEAAKKTAALTASAPRANRVANASAGSAAPAAAKPAKAPAAKKAPAKKKAPAEKPAALNGDGVGAIAPAVDGIAAPEIAADATTISSAPTNPEPADIKTDLITRDPLPGAQAETVTDPATEITDAPADAVENREIRAEETAPEDQATHAEDSTPDTNA